VSSIHFTGQLILYPAHQIKFSATNLMLKKKLPAGTADELTCIIHKKQ